MQVDVTARTMLSPEEKLHAVQRIEALESFAMGPVLGARVRVDCDENPRIAAPYHAEGELDVNGRLVRASVAGANAFAALDGLAARLERQLREQAGRRVARRRDTGEPEPGSWQHGDLTPERPAFFPRPTGERDVVRRKTFAMEPMAPLQAAADMADLDHDFYLFQDTETGADAVIHRLREDGRLGLIPAPDAAPQGDDTWLVVEDNRFSEPVPLQAAIEEMDALSHRFLYFVDRDSARGAVIYLRYDGHYGLIEAQ